MNSDRLPNDSGTESSPEYNAALRSRADHLKALPEGWDSYHGKRIDPETVDKAVEFAVAMAPLIPTYEPVLVPDSDGNVTVEFHAEGWDVECWIQRYRP